MPGEFIPLAEETGQIVPMTHWMLEARLRRPGAHAARCCRTAAGLRVSVNVSSRYLNHGNIVDDVRTVSPRISLEPECLILEVTESLLLENSARLERIFRELKTIGVRLALDDFGTGYSSLAYLHRFPIDILKIDRSFVERLARGRAPEGRGRGRARASDPVAGRCAGTRDRRGRHRDEAQRDTLLALGCRTGQGYAFGKAMPVAEVIDAAGHASPQRARAATSPGRSSTRRRADSAALAEKG